MSNEGAGQRLNRLQEKVGQGERTDPRLFFEKRRGLMLRRASHSGKKNVNDGVVRRRMLQVSARGAVEV